MSYWDVSEKEEFDIARAGQITRHKESGKQLYRILQEDNTIKRVVEIGTWNGRGSTLCVIHGIQGKNVESFHSIECNQEKHLAAVEFLESQMDDNTTLLWGSIIDPAHIRSDAYRKNFPGLAKSERLTSWFDIDLKNCEAAPNVLKDLPEQIDFLLLDGGEYTTLNEFETLLPRCVGYIALDDTLQDKSRECRLRLVNSSDWKEIVQLDERNGFSIFVRASRQFSLEGLHSDIVFYIAHYRTDITMTKLFNHSVRSIQEYYPSSDIVVCESPSAAERDGYDIYGVIWIDNPIPNSACIGCYKDYLTRYKDNKKRAFFMHDTMVLKSAINEMYLERPLTFLWSFPCDGLFASIEDRQMKINVFNMLSKYNMDHADYYGCFGWALYGQYSSIEKIWNEVPFEEYMQYINRGAVLRDLERVVGIAAFGLKLVSSLEEASLFGDIFQHPKAFGNKYCGESYEEIQKIVYSGSCIKYWGLRTSALDSVGISLGWNCGAATKGVEMGIRKKREDGYKTCPFDIMNSNLPGIIKCLEEDFAHFLDSDYLKLVDIPVTEKYHAGDTLILNTRYGFIFNHESPGHANLYITEKWEGGKEHFVKDDFLEFKKRYSSRIQNFRAYMKSGNTIRFLMNYPHTEYGGIADCIKKVYPTVSFSFYNTNEGGTDAEIFNAIHKQMGLI